jgi:hypothetical protein
MQAPKGQYDVSTMRRSLAILATFLLVFLAAAPAEGGSTAASGCGVTAYSYAGMQGMSKAYGISATLGTTNPPAVTDGHVGGWVGLGSTNGGPGGVAEWIQTGLAAFPADDTSQMYYEVTVAGSGPKYVELGSHIPAGVEHKFAVLEMGTRRSWWRVWVDGRPVSPPIHLPGSHDKWYPEALGENWNGNTGACNDYSYKFSNVTLATAQGGGWRPLESPYVFQDAGYHITSISQTPRTFLAASLAA